jgi:hypothetical protein
MKSIWKGSISFGLVNIPVKMYTAIQSHTLDLDMLRKGDLCQVHFARVCREDGKEIPYEDIVIEVITAPLITCFHVRTTSGRYLPFNQSGACIFSRPPKRLDIGGNS